MPPPLRTEGCKSFHRCTCCAGRRPWTDTPLSCCCQIVVQRYPVGMTATAVRRSLGGVVGFDPARPAPEFAGEVFVIGNQKGGVGKTSTACAMAGLMAAAGSKVLLVDLDPQGNTRDDLGYAAPCLLEQDVLLGQPARVASGVRPGLDVIAAGPELTGLATVLTVQATTGGDAAFPARRMVQSVRWTMGLGDYDVVVVDTPPGAGVLQQAALSLGTWLMVPARSDKSSRENITEIVRRMISARAVNPKIDLLGVYLFGVTSSAVSVRAQATRALLGDLDGLPVGTLFSSAIRHVEAAATAARERGRLPHELAGEVTGVRERIEAAKSGKPVVPQSTTSLAEDYEALVVEMWQQIAMRRETGW